MSGHGRRVGGDLSLLSVVHLSQASHATAPKFRVRVAVAPAVHGSLDQASLATKRHVEMGQSPANPVAVRLVHQTVAPVLILGAACPRVNAVLLLELLRQLLRVHGLDIASNGVLQLDAIPRVLERDPLHTVAVLPDDGRGRGGDRSGRSVGVHAGTRVAGALELAVVLGVVRGWHRRVLGLVKLERKLGLDLRPRAVAHAGLAVLRRVLAHGVTVCGVRHDHVGLGGHGLLAMLGGVSVGRRRRLVRHRLVGRLLVIHGLGHVLRRRLPIDAPVLVMLRRGRNGGGRVRLRSVVRRHRRVRPRHLSCGHHLAGVCGGVSAVRVGRVVGAWVVVVRR